VLLQHAQQLDLHATGEISPISSRNRVPPSACSNRPSRRRTAPVNAPLLVPEQLALEQRLGERGAVELDERPAGARAQRWWIALAISSPLPVPLSPVSSTEARLPRPGSTTAIHLLHGRGWSPMHAWSGATPLAHAQLRGAGSASRTQRVRRLIARSTTTSSSSVSSGLVR
jgi:hypothetical protein